MQVAERNKRWPMLCRPPRLDTPSRRHIRRGAGPRPTGLGSVWGGRRTRALPLPRNVSAHKVPGTIETGWKARAIPLSLSGAPSPLRPRLVMMRVGFGGIAVVTFFLALG